MKQYGLIGKKLGHSFSRTYFSKKFQDDKIDARYDLYELASISEFSHLIDTVEFQGLNVTIPYKEQVISYLDEMDETAEKIGAVNVIKFIRKGGKCLIRGYNSDAIGFMQSIEKYLQPNHQKALILGTGGASKAVDYGLKCLHVDTQFVSRNPSEGQLNYQDVDKALLTEYSVIVNTTPLGMYPNVDTCPDMPYHFLTKNHLLFDAVYNPAETLFLKRGKKQGALTVNGEEMLLGQAIAAWEIWNS